MFGVEVAFPEDLGWHPPPTRGLASYPDRSRGYDAVMGLAIGGLPASPVMGERTGKDGEVSEFFRAADVL